MDEEPAWSAEDIADLAGASSGRMVLDIFVAILRALHADPYLEEERPTVPEFLEIALVGDALAVMDDQRPKSEARRSERPRLLLVSQAVASEFLQKHHSALPYLNPRGLLYTIGVAVGPRLVAVATAQTPSGQFRSKACSPDGIIELSRIASDGSTKGASSMLASRILDLVPKSGRRGTEGCLFVTYSLLSESGTTYLALADKGLRPVAIRGGTKATGSRKKAGEEALRGEAKIVWHAGSSAAPAKWKVLDRTPATEAQIAGAKKQFEAWEAREEKAKKKSEARRPNPPGDHPYKYLGQCDRLRRGSPSGERAWQQMMKEKQRILKEEFLREADLAAVVDEDETPEDWIHGLEDPLFFRSRWKKKPAVFAEVAGFEFIFVAEERRRNPLDRAAVADLDDSADWSKDAIAEAAATAEKRFDVELAGPVHGCGNNGCAAPLTDGRVLKLTIDDLEAKWATYAKDLNLPGTVKVFAGPEVVAIDDWSAGEAEPGEDLPKMPVYAFVREDAVDVSPSTRFAIVEADHRAFPLLARDAPRAVKGVSLAPMRAAARLLHEHGYDLVDVKIANMGVTKSGEVVIRDAQLWPARHP